MVMNKFVVARNIINDYDYNQRSLKLID